MSETPISDAIHSYASGSPIRFHMPSHKGKPLPNGLFPSVAALDVTELEATGDLYDSNGIFRQSEMLAAADYGAQSAFYLTGGSTQGILSMISLVCRRDNHILFSRHIHRSVYNAMVFAGVVPSYLECPFDGKSGVQLPPSPASLENALDSQPVPSAFFVTSPTYFGAVAPIAEYARICHERGILLLVDEAHGAHFPFVDGMASSISLGADAAVVSLHKTLPAMTSAAMLLTGKEFEETAVREMTAVFGTSSPSYPIVLSSEAALAYMRHEGCQKANFICALLRDAADKIESYSLFRVLRFGMPYAADPMRLVINRGNSGISMISLAKALEMEYNIVVEMSDSSNVVFICSAYDTAEDIETLTDAVIALCPRHPASSAPPSPPPSIPLRNLLPREAFFSAREAKPLSLCEGLTAACHLAPYPPGVPIVAYGEIISGEAIAFLIENGFSPSFPTPVISGKEG